MINRDSSKGGQRSIRFYPASLNSSGRLRTHNNGPLQPKRENQIRNSGSRHERTW